MSDTVQCWCMSCNGYRSLSMKTVLKHIQHDRCNGFNSEWHDRYDKKPEDTISGTSFTKRTAIGKFISDQTEPRKKPLHGLTKLTWIDFSVTLLDIHVRCGLSEKDTNIVLDLIREALGPWSGDIPKNINEIKKKVDDLLVKHETYIFCPDNHRNKESDSVCNVCHAVLSKNVENAPKKYHYCPVIPRLQQLYDIPHVASIMQNHPSSKLHYTSMWKDRYSQTSPTDLTLSYCSDGFNPYHHVMKKGSYSIWAQSCEVLNLPPILDKSIPKLLIGMIPGPKMDIDMSLVTEIAVNEFDILQQGIETYDASTGKCFQLKGKIEMFILDVPGAAKELGHMQQNAAIACPRCYSQGMYCKTLSKMVYLESRRFLESDHRLRLEGNSYPDQATETRPPPESRTKKAETQIGRGLADMREENRKNPQARIGTAIKQLSKETGRTTGTPWQRLDLDINIDNLPVEPMHMIKGITSSILKLINGEDVTQKVKTAEEELGRFQHENRKKQRFNDEDRSEYCVPYTLTTSEKDLADLRLKSIICPDGFSDLPESLFTKVEGKTKSHTWLQVSTSGVINFCIRGMLGIKQRETLSNFYFVLSKLFDKGVTREIVDEYESRWHESLALMERDFPMSLKTINFHIAHHLPTYLKRFGSVDNFWMFGFERFNHTLIESIHSKKHPEKSAMNVIEIQWLTAILKCCGLVNRNGERNKGREKVPVGGDIKKYLIARGYVSDDDNLYEEKIVTIIETEEKSTTYRGEFTSKPASLVYVEVNGDLFCGRIVKLITTDSELKLCNVDWVGKIVLCNKSFCYNVIKVKMNLKNYINLRFVSAPLVHAYEEDKLWILSL
ncbi:hypothetical protein SNE40_006171 [Patella caerulea]|uniref:Transposase n=1 Tax=Patella caerulea TaxID=87958 RepID=A0AAN8Q458_PATCE